MIEHWQAMLAGVLFCLPACAIIAVMAALIELKERRVQEDKEDEELALEIERDDWVVKNNDSRYVD